MENGDTGGKIYSITPSISLRPTNWIREDVIFFSNMDLSLPTSKGFTCLTAIIAVVVELARHFTMPRSVFIQCMRKSAPNFDQEWLKRVADNLVSRHKIRGIVKFISENRDLFRPP
ncbi:hypothetical protein AVEN_146479-1 [Araneus ventricosus]|uniref:Uncharacterized protein n=1 Tax=Araneus ventricosus TaxID=182803 RepID=A0A4Y2X2S5_ARAVE|nr:hypothetical protein AVEN_6714-1 [Araneus ventricosus]GBO43871.1 hypothetical protein AVEN_155162-1 [Araneus ventricosus]GBO43876.1 hypothetical protein AVEN_81039-1 [Araneus ventricosus]GBO43879.1 hypothetical protein AVEN_146479-1 [Araneus ventricosus]